MANVRRTMTWDEMHRSKYPIVWKVCAERRLPESVQAYRRILSSGLAAEGSQHLGRLSRQVFKEVECEPIQARTWRYFKLSVHSHLTLLVLESTWRAVWSQLGVLREAARLGMGRNPTSTGGGGSSAGLEMRALRKVVDDYGEWYWLANSLMMTAALQSKYH